MAEKKSPNDIVVIEHKDVDGEGRVLRSSFDKIWSDKGWKIKDEKGPAVSSPPSATGETDKK